MRIRFQLFLVEFISKVYVEDAFLGDSFMETTKAWIFTMTTSPWMLIRHTATTICCDIMRCLCLIVNKLSEKSNQTAEILVLRDLTSRFIDMIHDICDRLAILLFLTTLTFLLVYYSQGFMIYVQAFV